jgi:hypothetical protein
VALLTRSGGGGGGGAADASTYLADHSGSVFYLALVLGSAVRDYVVRERVRQTSAAHLSASVSLDLLPLGLGAMFMDLGMYPLERLFAPDYVLTAEDRAQIRQHPSAGAELLPETLPPGARMVVRTHHENYDGTGYPAGMPGADQHVFTRIIRLCDAYEAATATRVYAAAKSPARVLWEICAGAHRNCYDPVLAKVFRTLIQPFPIGAKLRLSDGRWGVLVRYNRKDPFKPLVIVAFDESGNRLPPEELRPPLTLGEDNDLRLASFDGEDLSYLYQTPAEPAGPPDYEHLETLMAASYP